MQEIFPRFAMGDHIAEGYDHHNDFDYHNNDDFNNGCIASHVNFLLQTWGKGIWKWRLHEMRLEWWTNN